MKSFYELNLELGKNGVSIDIALQAYASIVDLSRLAIIHYCESLPSFCHIITHFCPDKIHITLSLPKFSDVLIIFIGL